LNSLDAVKEIFDYLGKSRFDEFSPDLLIKSILYKFLLENGYLTKGFSKNIFNDFTYKNILSRWDVEAHCSLEESTNKANVTEIKFCTDYILKGPSLKDCDPVLIGLVYEELSETEIKKKSGRFYTPGAIIDLMIGFYPQKWSYPCKVLDPACGSGFFLSKVYDKMMESGLRQGFEKDKVHHNLLQDMIYGMDLDEKGIFISSLVLSLKSKIYIQPKNLFPGDFLTDNSSWKGFDLIVGNPPYIGHKQMNREYFKVLKDKYQDVYYDKADISYCFFKRGWEVLSEGGLLIFITSRYFLEAHNGKGLRDFIANNFKIEKIIDYNGYRIMPGAKVDPLISVFAKGSPKGNSFSVHKYTGEMISRLINQRSNDGDSTENFEIFNILQQDLDKKGWSLIDRASRDIIVKITSKTDTTISDVWDSRQGIITGCDKAFVVDNLESRLYDEVIVKPWIKNSDITQYEIRQNNKYLLYTDLLEDASDHPQLMKRLLPYEARLKNRRECKKGIRPWHHLQWGRSHENFTGDKVVYPYKSHKNRFAVDTKGCYFSADVYCFRLKQITFASREFYTLQAVTALLNSSLYEFYFKTIAKKLGENLYEYYPNTVGRLRLPKYDPEFFKALHYHHESIQNSDNEEASLSLKEDIDSYIFDYFSIGKAEKDLIERRIKLEKL